MIRTLQVFLCGSLLASAIYAQASTVTPLELLHFRNILNTLTANGPSPENARDAYITKQFGLNANELAAINGAATASAAVLRQLTRTQEAISTKSTLSSADLNTLAALEQQVTQELRRFASAVLSAVRPEVAAHMRAPAQMLMTAPGH
jgi:hypothetical protein